MLGAQPLPHRALVAALVGALQTSEAEEVAVLAAETAAAVHLSAVGHLAELHAAVFDAQGAGLGGSVAPLDGARVAAAVLDAEPRSLTGVVHPSTEHRLPPPWDLQKPNPASHFLQSGAWHSLPRRAPRRGP